MSVLTIQDAAVHKFLKICATWGHIACIRVRLTFVSLA